MPFCMNCRKELTANEIGLHRKLVNRGSKEYLCLSCLGKHFHIDETELRRLIDHFRQAGCSLFR